jgi:hypothetical protein
VLDNGEKRSKRPMKITRILLGYKAELRIKPKDQSRTDLPESLTVSGNMTKSVLGMPSAGYRLDKDSEGQVMVASAPTGFPAVLAVLGREI